MLRSIEQATRQPIQPMQIPSHADIADRRIVQFKQLITDTLEDQDLGFFEDLISNYQQEQDLSLPEIAASLAYLVQKEKPLVPPEKELSSDNLQALQTSTWAADLGKPSQEQMQLFRIEVGRQHEVLPKNIVGAIANEVNLAPRYIGQIKLFDTFSTVYLPECMPKPIFQHLKQVRVRGQKLEISLSEQKEKTGRRPAKPSPRKGKHKKQTRSKAKAGKN